MIVVTTHLNADFDCLASMTAACRLYPSAVAIFPGSQERQVRLFLEQQEHHIPIRKLKGFDLSQITKLVVVDTSSSQRLGVLGELCKRDNVEVEVFDHHPKSASNIKSTGGRVAKRGANATLMVEVLKERRVEIKPQDATMLMLGIYEDTGSLKFTSTCAEDFQAAEYLLSKGADLTIVSEYLHYSFNPAQIKLLHQMLDNLEQHMVNGVEVNISFATADRYIGDMANVVHSLREMQPSAALFVLVEMEGKVYLVARSSTIAINAATVAEAFGGGGHETAAAATIHDSFLNEAKARLLLSLKQSIAPAPTAAEMMVTHIFSGKAEETLTQIEKKLTQHNINGMPILEDGKVLGIISRQVVEKALAHGLGDEAVESYMEKHFYSVKKDDSYEAVREIVLAHRQRIVPVLDEQKNLIGILCRLDVMSALYDDFIKSPSAMFYPQRKTGKPVAKNMTKLMQDSLPEKAKQLLLQVATVADEIGYTAYVVGGFVRDLLLHRQNLDIDIVIEGDGIEFANRYAEKYGCKVKQHKLFKTAILLIGGGEKIDVATARTEYYPEPAALPIVAMSSIKNDLFRRDFTINGLAIRLNGSNSNSLIDFFGGRQDLKDNAIRVLHNLSFVEDPTRLYRAVRFAVRFHFSLGGQTEALLKLAVKRGLVRRVSGSRLFNELNAIFKEKQPERCIRKLAEYGLLKAIQESINYNDEMRCLVEAVHESITWHQLSGGGGKLRHWLIYLYAISSRLSKNEAAEFFDRLGIDPHPAKTYGKQRQMAINLLAKVDQLSSSRPEEIYMAFKGLEVETLLLMMSALPSEQKKIVTKYITHIKNIRCLVNGNLLKDIGITDGKQIGKTLEAIKMEKLSIRLESKEAELAFAKKWNEL